MIIVANVWRQFDTARNNETRSKAKQSERMEYSLGPDELKVFRGNVAASQAPRAFISVFFITVFKNLK